jgi:cytidine deaminase
VSARKKKATAKGKTKAKAKAPRVDSALLDQLVQEAKAVRELAYAPYSRYQVGAAIATKRGSIYVGCNVENASFGATICAERGAIMQMIAHGDREPIACAVVTGDEGASPCGICRQVLAEFATDMPVVLVGLGSREGETGRVVQLADLLPLAFRLTSQPK